MYLGVSGWILGVSGWILGGALGGAQNGCKSGKAMFHVVWDFYPLISAFQALSHMPNDRS